MPLTSDTVEELNRLIDVFFEKVGRKERLRKQILKLMDECEAYLYPKIRDWMQLSRKQIIRDIKNRILKFEKKSKSQIIIDYVDWETIEEEGKSIIKPAYLNIMERSGNLSRAHARIEASFDVINPLSVKWAEKYSYELITLVEKETKKGIREIVSHGLKEGKTLTQVARDIEHLKDVGLNGRQSAALLKYRKVLEAQKLPKELYLQKYTKRYDRLLRDRSELIARTEVSRSVNEGYLDSLEGTRYEEVEISSAGDACSECLDLAGQRFTRAEARGVLPKHPNCRCHWIVVVPRKKKPGVPKKPKVPGKPKTPGMVRSGIEKIHKDSIEELAGLERQSYRYQKRSLEFKRLGLTDSAEKYKDLYLKNEAKIDFIRIRDNIKMRKMLQVSEEGFNLYPEWAELIKEREKPFFKNAIKEFSKLIDKESTGVMFPRVGKTAARSFYSRGSIYIGKPSILYENTEVVVHELGHWLEDMNPKVHESIMAFYKKRTKGEGLVRLLDGYGADELTRKDKFIDVYMGKDYEGKASEILSMGLGEFYKNPYRLATKDPGYFDFIYNLVRGKY